MTMDVKVIGGTNLPSIWERFDRLQRTANKLGGMKYSPRGVFRFESHEAFETWKRNLILNRHDPQRETT